MPHLLAYPDLAKAAEYHDLRERKATLEEVNSRMIFLSDKCTDSVEGKKVLTLLNKIKGLLDAKTISNDDVSRIIYEFSVFWSPTWEDLYVEFPSRKNEVDIYLHDRDDFT